jgi:hypothetical protein
VSGDEISSVIEKIIKNPEFAGMVSEIKGTPEAKNEDVSAEMMKKLPEVMGMVSSMFDGSGGEEKSTSAPNVEDTAATSKTVVGKFDKSKAEKLFYALKPYLSGQRCEIIDRCMSVLQVSDIARAVGGLEGLSSIFKKGGE